MANSNIATAELLYKQIFDTMPLGLFIVGTDLTIRAWNQWMVSNTHIKVKNALGKTIKALYPDVINPRFDCALEMALSQGYPQLISNILNKYVIPIPLNNSAYPELTMMQQNIEILPYNNNEENMALVVIKDASEKTHLTNTLISMAARYEKNSLIDSLTGLYNRRFLWKYLEQELLTAKREQYDVICCLFDLDYFKKINDEFGHNGGDEVLTSFSKISLATIRPSDVFVRYGGEEFIGIFSNIKIEDGIKLANRLRIRLSNTPSHGNINTTITCSGGISYWKHSDPTISPEKLVDMADFQLYQAKEKGRNCIVIDNTRQD